jgi:hypothetical protein
MSAMRLIDQQCHPEPMRFSSNHPQIDCSPVIIGTCYIYRLRIRSGSHGGNKRFRIGLSIFKTSTIGRRHEMRIQTEERDSVHGSHVHGARHNNDVSLKQRARNHYAYRYRCPGRDEPRLSGAEIVSREIVCFLNVFRRNSEIARPLKLCRVATCQRLNPFP